MTLWFFVIMCLKFWKFMNEIYPIFISKKLLNKLVGVIFFRQLKFSMLQNVIKKLTVKKIHEQHRSQWIFPSNASCPTCSIWICQCWNFWKYTKPNLKQFTKTLSHLVMQGLLFTTYPSQLDVTYATMLNTESPIKAKMLRIFKCEYKQSTRPWCFAKSRKLSADKTIFWSCITSLIRWSME